MALVDDAAGEPRTACASPAPSGSGSSHHRQRAPPATSYPARMLGRSALVVVAAAAAAAAAVPLATRSAVGTPKKPLPRRSLAAAVVLPTLAARHRPRTSHYTPASRQQRQCAVAAGSSRVPTTTTTTTTTTATMLHATVPRPPASSTHSPRGRGQRFHSTGPHSVASSRAASSSSSSSSVAPRAAGAVPNVSFGGGGAGWGDDAGAGTGGDAREATTTMTTTTPRSLVAHLDEYVIGQSRAKKVLAVGVFNHYVRLGLGRSAQPQPPTLASATQAGRGDEALEARADASGGTERLSSGVEQTPPAASHLDGARPSNAAPAPAPAPASPPRPPSPPPVIFPSTSSSSPSSSLGGARRTAPPLPSSNASSRYRLGPGSDPRELAAAAAAAHSDVLSDFVGQAQGSTRGADGWPVPYDERDHQPDGLGAASAAAEVGEETTSRGLAQPQGQVGVARGSTVGGGGRPREAEPESDSGASDDGALPYFSSNVPGVEPASAGAGADKAEAVPSGTTSTPGESLLSERPSRRLVQDRARASRATTTTTTAQPHPNVGVAKTGPAPLASSAVPAATPAEKVGRGSGATTGAATLGGAEVETQPTGYPSLSSTPPSSGAASDADRATLGPTSGLPRSEPAPSVPPLPHWTTATATAVVAKSNVLLLGPSGSGKTLLVSSLAQRLGVPFVTVDATPLTQAGYVGEDVESVVERLMDASGWDVASAQRGIVCLDEADKLARRPGDVGSKDVSGEGVQQALLRLLEGAQVVVTDKSGRRAAAAAAATHAHPHLGSGGPDPSTGSAASRTPYPVTGPWWPPHRESSSTPSNMHGTFGTPPMPTSRGWPGLGGGGGGPGAGPNSAQGTSYTVDTTNVLFVLCGAFSGLADVVRRRLLREATSAGKADEILRRLGLPAAPGDDVVGGDSAGHGAKTTNADRAGTTRAPPSSSSSSQRPAVGAADDVGGKEGVRQQRRQQRQQELTRLLQGEEAEARLYEMVEPEDLMAYGLIPEFLGRVPILAPLRAPSEADLLRVLTEPRNALKAQYETLFAQYGVELRFTRRALRRLAQQAHAASSTTGARALRRICEERLLDAMYAAPGGAVRYALVDARAASGEAEVHLFSRGGKMAFERAWRDEEELEEEAAAEQEEEEERQRAAAHIVDETRGPDGSGSGGLGTSGVGSVGAASTGTQSSPRQATEGASTSPSGTAASKRGRGRPASSSVGNGGLTDEGSASPVPRRTSKAGVPSSPTSSRSSVSARSATSASDRNTDSPRAFGSHYDDGLETPPRADRISRAKDGVTGDLVSGAPARSPIGALGTHHVDTPGQGGVVVIDRRRNRSADAPHTEILGADGPTTASRAPPARRRGASDSIYAIDERSTDDSEQRAAPAKDAPREQPKSRPASSEARPSAEAAATSATPFSARPSPLPTPTPVRVDEAAVRRRARFRLTRPSRVGNLRIVAE